MSMFVEHDWKQTDLSGYSAVNSPARATIFHSETHRRGLLPFLSPIRQELRDMLIMQQNDPFCSSPATDNLFPHEYLSYVCMCLCVYLQYNHSDWALTVTLCIFELFIVNNFTRKVAKVTDDSRIAFIQNNHLFLHFITFVWLLWLLSQNQLRLYSLCLYYTFNASLYISSEQGYFLT